MGVSVREKPKDSGIYWVFIRHGGTRKSRRIGSKKKAEKIAADLEKRLLAGEFVKQKVKGPLFSEQSKKWLDLIGLTRKASTHERYWQVTRDFITPRFGKRPISDISKKDIRDFFVDLAKKGHSRDQLDIIRACLRGPLEQAFADGVIDLNPTDRVLRSLHLDRNRMLVQVLDAREQIVFLDTAKATDPEMHPFFLFLLRTGVRLGEGLGIQWQDIDFEKGLVWIRRTYRRGIFTLPKTGRPRPVQLSGETVRTLQALRLVRGGIEDRFVFAVDAEGMTPYHQNSVRNRFKAILKKAGLRRETRIHTLRHCYVTNRLSLGHPIEQVSKEAGHSSVEITSTVYCHWIPEKAGGMIDDLDRLGRPEKGSATWHPSGTLWHPAAASG
jgi:integrase